jgi:hypothetical protein
MLNKLYLFGEMTCRASPTDCWWNALKTRGCELLESRLTTVSSAQLVEYAGQCSRFYIGRTLRILHCIQSFQCVQEVEDDSVCSSRTNCTVRTFTFPYSQMKEKGINRFPVFSITFA